MNDAGIRIFWLKKTNIGNFNTLDVPIAPKTVGLWAGLAKLGGVELSIE
jgi:hypothetical protein